MSNSNSNISPYYRKPRRIRMYSNSNNSNYDNYTPPPVIKKGKSFNKKNKAARVIQKAIRKRKQTRPVSRSVSRNSRNSSGSNTGWSRYIPVTIRRMGSDSSSGSNTNRKTYIKRILDQI